MNSAAMNTGIIFLLTLIVIGAGYFVTEVHLPEKVQQLEDSKKLDRLQQAEVTQLLSEEATSAEMANLSVRRWKSRYKVFPEELATPDVVEYLEELATSRFEDVDVALNQVVAKPYFSYYVFNVSGTAYPSDLYDFIWKIENNPSFYQVEDLKIYHTVIYKENPKTGVPRRHDMTSFAMKLKAFFSTTEGLSADQETVQDIPDGLLPATKLARNAFYPIVKAEVPPNDRLLVDVENDRLVSIIGKAAVFENEFGRHVLRETEEVYLGRILEVDPGEGGSQGKTQQRR